MGSLGLQNKKKDNMNKRKNSYSHGPRIWLSIFACFIITSSFLIISVCAELSDLDTTETPQNKLTLAITLVDGSMLVGIPTLDQIKIKTSYATMDIPFKGIDNIKFEKNTNNAKIRFTNGDLLNSNIIADSLELDTLLGNIFIALKHIDSIEISIQTGEQLPSYLLKGLVLHYSFDKDKEGKITDKSDKGNDGKAHGTTWIRKGKVGGARQFNGISDRIETGYNSSLFPSDTFTVCTWIKATTTDKTSYITAGTYNKPPGIYHHIMGINRNKTPFFISKNNEMRIKAETSIHLEKWEFLCCTFDRNVRKDNAKMYLNGI